MAALASVLAPAEVGVPTALTILVVFCPATIPTDEVARVALREVAVEPDIFTRRPETVTILPVEALAYVNGRVTMFPDVVIVPAVIPDPPETVAVALTTLRIASPWI
jgi:hypothetical protein